VLRVTSLWKTYEHADGPVHALRDVSLRVPQRSFVTIAGPSGAGKSTLLLALGGLLRPSSGEIQFRDLPLHSLGDARLAAFRRASVGFVMQSFCLVPYLTALGNVMLPLGLQRVPRDEQVERSRAVLAELGLEDRANHLPRELSAGQQQRVAIARATVTRPALVLADEPTGNLDPALAREIQALLQGLNRERGLTIVMVTHSPEAAALGTVRLRMEAGAVVSCEGSEVQATDSLLHARA